MARPSTFTPAQWQQIRDAAIAGVPDAHICEEYGISPSNLEKRRWREKWPTPARLKAKAAAAAPRMSGHLSGVCPPDIKKAETLALESAEAVAKGCLHSWIHRAAPVLDKWTPSEPASMQEGALLVRTIAKASGLDSARSGGRFGVQVCVGPWGGESGVPACRDIEE